MRGVILCGGMGTRLRPLTSVVNKHLVPIYDQPMCFYGLQMLAESGIKEVMMILGGQSMEELMRLCKDGREFGFERLYYSYQEGEGGIAAALALTEQFANGEDVCVVLGDNLILGESLAPYKIAFEKEVAGHGAMVLLSEVQDPQNYGVAVIEKSGRIVNIIEKPEFPPSKLAVIGVYFYDWSVFERIKNCTPSRRGELEITDVNNSYAQEGILAHKKIRGKWIDAGSSIEAWLHAGQLVEQYRKPESVGK